MECQIRKNEHQRLFIVSLCELRVRVQMKKKTCTGLSHATNSCRLQFWMRYIIMRTMNTELHLRFYKCVFMEKKTILGKTSKGVTQQQIFTPAGGQTAVTAFHLPPGGSVFIKPRKSSTSPHCGFSKYFHRLICKRAVRADVYLALWSVVSGALSL